MGEWRGFYGVLIGRPEGKRPFRKGVSGRINIKIDLREAGIDRVNWILLAQDRVQWWAL
jgi:hypothetical protein